MYAVEFSTNIERGSIKIPKQYIDKLGNKVKVIILAEHPEEKTFNFSALGISTKEFKFSREIANER
jgi:hypothetical protein